MSSLKRAKVTTLFSFERNRKRRHDKMLLLTSLRSNNDEGYPTSLRTSTEQLIASDATLDLHMEDGGENTNLTGVCALRDEGSASASVYQLNSLGDLFSHRVSFGRSSTKSYHAAIQSGYVGPQLVATFRLVVYQLSLTCCRDVAACQVV